jgi:signal transduction histidine kinase
MLSGLSATASDAASAEKAAAAAPPLTEAAVERAANAIEASRAEEDAFQRDRFLTRARALFYSRLAFLAIGLGVISIPAWSEAFSIRTPTAYVIYLGMVLYSAFNYVVLDRPRFGVYVTFTTLCLDLLVIIYLVVATGGLSSPLIASQLLFTLLFVMLFPRPLAIVPPLLVFPVVAKIDQILGGAGPAVIEVFIVLWLSALNLIVVYVIVYLNERDTARHRQIVRLQHELKDLAVMEERARLGREIHDGLGGALSSILIQAEILEGLATDLALKEEIRELREIAGESIDELRRSLAMMREDFDLPRMVEEHCRQVEVRHRIAVKFEAAGRERKIAPDTALTVYRVLQESLTNARKHGGGGAIGVKLEYAAGELRLAVKDEGKGFDPGAEVSSGHYGLLNLRERARRAGGELSVKTAPGQGTEVMLRIPERS